MQSNYMIQGDPLSLERIRSVLIRLEDTIIFSLIERAQFAHNPKIYERGAMKELQDVAFQGSWLEWFLAETEAFHAKARRYTSPDEYPFTTNLPDPVISLLKFPEILYPNNINVNASILSLYTRSIVPRITRATTIRLATLKRSLGYSGDGEYEDDGNYGSAATIDVEVLQAISKRVHYGKFVSESKFRSNPAAFIPHIKSKNRDELGALITKPEVERKLLHRVRNKTSMYGQGFGPDGLPLSLAIPQSPQSDEGINSLHVGAGKIDVDSVVELYELYIIPLTKEVEVEYLIHRLDGLSEEEIIVLSQKGTA